MDTLSFKIPAELRRRLAREARRRGVSKSTVIRECLEAALSHQPRARAELTCADLAGNLIGSMRGPGDASTNPARLDEAIVTDAKLLGKREAAVRAARLICANRELFGRLAGKNVSATVKRTIKDYRKTLRKLT